jgi:hypothetical protein
VIPVCNKRAYRECLSYCHDKWWRGPVESGDDFLRGRKISTVKIILPLGGELVTHGCGAVARLSHMWLDR